MKRRSRYQRPPAAERLPLRFDSRDMDLLKLYGPEHDFHYLWAATMGLLLDRKLHRVQLRVQRLWHHKILGKTRARPKSYAGGSLPDIYFLDTAGARRLSEYYQRPIAPNKLDPMAYHPFLQHQALLDQIKGYVYKALADYPGLETAYSLRDGVFYDRFKAPPQITKNGQEIQGETWYKLTPDWPFALIGGRDEHGQSLPLRNLWLELQCKNNVTKNPETQRSRYKSLRHRFEGYSHFFLNKRWQDWGESKKAQIKNPQNLRVLWLTYGMSEKEHSHLIETARSSDPRGVGLRLFWFLRWETLEGAPEKFTMDELDKVGVIIEDQELPVLRCLQCSRVWQPQRLKSGGLPKDYWKCPNYQTRCNHPDPVKKIKEAIWHTPVIGDEPRSIFTSH